MKLGLVNLLDFLIKIIDGNIRLTDDTIFYILMELVVKINIWIVIRLNISNVISYGCLVPAFSVLMITRILTF